MPTANQIAVINEFGGLYSQSQAWAPKQKRLDALKDEIRSWYPNLAADATELASSNCYVIQIGAKSIEKSWASMADVYKAVGGLKAFLKLCTVTFKALAGVIGNTAAEAMQVEERSGSRSVKAIPAVPVVFELFKAS